MRQQRSRRRGSRWWHRPRRRPARGEHRNVRHAAHQQGGYDGGHGRHDGCGGPVADKRSAAARVDAVALRITSPQTCRFVPRMRAVRNSAAVARERSTRTPRQLLVGTARAVGPPGARRQDVLQHGVRSRPPGNRLRDPVRASHPYADHRPRLAGRRRVPDREPPVPPRLGSVIAVSPPDSPIDVEQPQDPVRCLPLRRPHWTPTNCRRFGQSGVVRVLMRDKGPCSAHLQRTAQSRGPQPDRKTGVRNSGGVVGHDDTATTSQKKGAC